LGNGNFWFIGVTTKDDVPKWVRKNIWKELAAAGCKASKRADAKVRVKVKEVDASLGPLHVSSRLLLGVEVTSGRQKLFSKDLSAAVSPFSLASTTASFEDALRDTFAEWNRENMPAIIKALEKAKPPPAEPETPHAPVITIIEPWDGAVFRNPSIAFAAKIENVKGLAQVLLVLNGKKKEIARGTKTLEPGGKITLKPGPNSVEIQVHQSGKAILVEKLSITYSPYAPPGRKVLAVGISSFKNIPGSFEGEQSAGGFASAIMDNLPEKAMTNVKLLSGDDADMQAVFKNLKKVLTTAAKDEYAIIFYSGKMFTSEGKLIFAMQDTEPTNLMTAMSLKYVALQMAGGFKGKGLLLVLGGIPDKDGEKAIAAAVKREPGLSVLAIGSLPTSIGEALKGKADKNADGHVSIKELRALAKKSGLFGTIDKDFILR
jgi:hypothetical protein